MSIENSFGKRVLLLLAAVAFALIPLLAVFGQERGPAVAVRVKDVAVRPDRVLGCYGGSGVVVGRSDRVGWLVLTNRHVVQHSKTAARADVSVWLDRAWRPAVIVSLSQKKEHDLALLSVLCESDVRKAVPSLLPPGDGEQVVSHVFSQGLYYTQKSGTVHLAANTARGKIHMPGVYFVKNWPRQYQPGESGSPVVNQQGELVGLVVGKDNAYIGATGLDLCVSWDAITEFLSQHGWRPATPKKELGGVDEPVVEPTEPAVPKQPRPAPLDDVSPPPTSTYPALPGKEPDHAPADAGDEQEFPAEEKPKQAVLEPRKAGGPNWSAILGTALLWGGAAAATAVGLGVPAALGVAGWKVLAARMALKAGSAVVAKRLNRGDTAPPSSCVPPVPTASTPLGSHAEILGLLCRVLATRKEGTPAEPVTPRAEPATTDDEGGVFVPSRATEELHQLLQLRRLEGRDPVLDAGYGMFAQLELDEAREKARHDPQLAKTFQELQDNIWRRVSAVAPISLKQGH